MRRTVEGSDFLSQRAWGESINREATIRLNIFARRQMLLHMLTIVGQTVQAVQWTFVLHNYLQ